MVITHLRCNLFCIPKFDLRSGMFLFTYIDNILKWCVRFTLIMTDFEVRLYNTFFSAPTLSQIFSLSFSFVVAEELLQLKVQSQQPVQTSHVPCLVAAGGGWRHLHRWCCLCCDKGREANCRTCWSKARLDSNWRWHNSQGKRIGSGGRKDLKWEAMSAKS